MCGGFLHASSSSFQSSCSRLLKCISLIASCQCSASISFTFRSPSVANRKRLAAHNTTFRFSRPLQTNQPRRVRRCHTLLLSPDSLQLNSHRVIPSSGFAKPMDALRDNEEYDDESDSDDADFVPGEAPDSDVSENDDKTAEGKLKAASKGKRKKNQKRRGKKLKRNSDDSDDDDLDDEDFSVKLDPTSNEHDEQTKEVDEEEEKKRTDRLWSDFLSGVEELTKKKTSDTNVPELTTKKVYDFAGERVVVEEKVLTPVPNGTSSKESSNLSSATDISRGESNVAVASTARDDMTSSAEPSASTGFPVRKGRISFLSGSPAQIGLLAKPGAKKTGGLSAVLSAIQSNKKQKMGTLEKSRLDWQAFKKDEGIDEELKTHVKSKDGYVDRQEFLHRADVRQFEIEKSLRTRQRRNT